MGTVTFSYTGAEQTWPVPAGVTSVQVDMAGAQGGGATGGTGGKGGRVQVIIPSNPGDTWGIYVGGVGSGTAGGFNGGGNGANGEGGSTPTAPSAGGGGSSDIRDPASAASVSVLQSNDGSSLPLSFGSSVTAGSAVFLVIVAATFSGATISSSAPTLGGSSVTGARALFNVGGTNGINSPHAGSNGAYLAIWMLPNVPSGSTAVSATVTNGTVVGAFIYEVPGLGASPVIAASSSGTGNSTPIDSGPSGTVGLAPAFVLGSAATFSGSAAGPAGWTKLSPNGNSWAGYQIPGSPGSSYDWAQTGSSAEPWSAAVVAVVADNRLVVAAGGGGAGSALSGGGNGGGGNGPTGDNGSMDGSTSGTPAQGGTATAGGAGQISSGQSGTAGTLGAGASTPFAGGVFFNNPGGGAGSGLYGGGSAIDGGGGAGGASHGPAGVTYTDSYQPGNGYVTLTWASAAAAALPPERPLILSAAVNRASNW